MTILKYERSAADAAFDAEGGRFALPDQSDDAISLYVERGLTRRLTFQGRAGWTRGKDGFADYGGRGPLELGLRYTLLKGDRGAVSLYAGGALAGEGRNAGYADVGAGRTDVEVRLLAGRSVTVAGRSAFVDAQLARLARSGLSDETHLDLTLGMEPAARWLVMAQAYAGRADRKPDGPSWLKLEVSAARRVGAWRLQAGWRQTVAGRAVPIERGPVLALWRAF